MPPKPTGPPPPPTVQKLRLQYAKHGRLRFSSHRDFQRMLERALRRIDAPMAYSAGFNPHPKISFAGAAPTGAASQCEYVELGLVREVDPTTFAEELSDALPVGLDIVTAVVAKKSGFADLLTGSQWHIHLADTPVARAQKAVDLLLEQEQALVEKVTKKGRREVDVRAAVVALTVLDGATISSDDKSGQQEPGQCAIIEAVVRHTTPVVRPDDVLTALRDVANLAPATPPVVTRLAQGPLDDKTATVANPLAGETD